MFSAPSGESWLIPDLGQFDLTSRESDLNACTYKCMNCLLFIIELKQWNFLASLKAAPRLPWCLASRPKNRFLASQNWPRSAIIASCKCHLFNSKIIHDFWDMGEGLKLIEIWMVYNTSKWCAQISHDPMESFGILWMYTHNKTFIMTISTLPMMILQPIIDCHFHCCANIWRETDVVSIATMQIW